MGANNLNANKEVAQWIHKIEKGVLQGWHFSLSLFNLYSKTILRELVDLPGFIIDRYNLSIRSVNDTMLKAVSEKLKELLDNVGMECKYSY